jgi:prepilin-type N-terminal cleavage/methylation domain-containing protein
MWSEGAMRGDQRQSRHGLTLVDVMIVVVILGILAAALLPQFTDSGRDAPETALVQDLQTLRSEKPRGPYFIGQVPPNPYNGGRSVKVVLDVAGALPGKGEQIGSDQVGWIDNPETGRIKANGEEVGADNTSLHEF